MPTTLTAGDIAFTAFQADNSGGGANGDMFEFVLLKNVTVGTTIYFTDGGYRTDVSAFRTNENVLRWVAQTDLLANTKVAYVDSAGNNEPNSAEWTGITATTGVATAANSALGLASGGDNITALVNPTFAGTDALTGTAIAQITFGGTAFATTFNASSGNATTALAPGLTDGVNAISIAATDNGRYDPSASGSIETGAVATVRNSINTDTYWTTSTTPLSGDGRTTATFTAVCYLHGTHIRTPTGAVAIEELRIGNLVVTIDGIQPIRWIGNHAYPREVLGKWARPVTIRAGALGDNLPTRDLHVSPWHAILFGQVMLRAIDLVNGHTIVQDFAGERAEYLNLEFEAPTVIFAEGLAAESYTNHRNRQMFANAAEYDALYGDDARMMLDDNGRGIRRFPLVVSGPAFAAVREDIANRAGLSMAVDQAA